MHFERLENWPINPAVAITGITVHTDLECNWLCLKGRDFEELERIDKGLAPFTSWEDIWLVDSNSGSSSWDVKSPLYIELNLMLIVWILSKLLPYTQSESKP